MSLVRALLQRFRRRSYLVGRDFESNRYYEHPSLLDDPRPRRTVKYRSSDDVYKYIGGHKRLAVQWSSWLTHTRPDPPTLEELQADSIRQERMRRNVALLQARDRDDVQLRIAESTPRPKIEATPQTSKPSSHPPGAGEPGSWNPQATTRGS
ncbi:hypothetical protein C8F01DRAFT_1249893 [Mycena amicta]|nr:hypothetical protein C8F01DRAFT_1249893 [Mycena amicta]